MVPMDDSLVEKKEELILNFNNKMNEKKLEFMEK